MTKNFLVKPSSKPIMTEIKVPGDKSISHRALMLAAIADGESIIHNFLSGEDCLSTLEALRTLGVTIDGPSEHHTVWVKGVGKEGLKAPASTLQMGNSGTSMRLLTGLLAGQGIAAVLVGDASLMKRPMGRVVDPLKEMGATLSCGADGCPPIVIQRPSQPLRGMTFQSKVPSAQVKSALLLAGLYAEGKTTVVEPVPTRDHTERMLTSFGYAITQTGKAASLTGGGRLKGTEISVPGDISSAAFFLTAAAMMPGAKLCIKSVGVNPGRVGIIAIVQQMGAYIRLDNKRYLNNEPIADLWVEGRQLQGITIPPEQITAAIDEFPAIFIAAATATGMTVLKGARELRVKESDRIMAMTEGLTTLGINAEALEDGIIIQGGQLGGGTVNSFGDHRIAMAFSIAGFMATEPIVVENCESVATSFPLFTEIAQHCGLEIEETEV